jgi:hypothetical protein
MEIFFPCEIFMQITYGQNDWLVIGDGQWTWPNGVVTQTSVGIQNPQEVYFHTGSNELKRTVAARLHVAALDNLGQFGLSILNNGETGINLIISVLDWDLEFLEDNYNTAYAGLNFVLDVGDYFWLKAFYDPAANMCYGKFWLDGDDEPAEWQVTYQPSFYGHNGDGNGNPANFPYFGVNGTCNGEGMMCTVDSFALVLASEVPAFKPLFRPRNHLIGGGF